MLPWLPYINKRNVQKGRDDLTFIKVEVKEDALITFRKQVFVRVTKIKKVGTAGYLY